ncbi:MAG: hypothetical protein ACD_75C02040G0001 [uncultured bacterium]|nr:MAG: hypothetical protein ACD_75C02040G0001 [uncultured bacterium]
MYTAARVGAVPCVFPELVIAACPGILLFLATAARCVLPFRFRGQTIFLPALRIQFCQKFLNIVPADLLHRTFFSAILEKRRVAAHNRLPLTLRHFIFPDVEIIDAGRADRLLVCLTIPEGVSHLETPPLDQYQLEGLYRIDRGLHTFGGCLFFQRCLNTEGRLNPYNVAFNGKRQGLYRCNPGYRLDRFRHLVGPQEMGRLLCIAEILFLGVIFHLGQLIRNRIGGSLDRCLGTFEESCTPYGNDRCLKTHLRFECIPGRFE